jgi:type I restriction enzyme S subunit
MTGQTDSKKPGIRFKGFDKEWAEATVSDFVRSLDAGVSVNSGDRAANSSEFGILKTSAVTNGVFEATENKVVLTESEQSRLKESVTGGTIIISRMNTPALVGANAYVESDHANLFLPDRLWAAKQRDGNIMRFLAFILGSEKGRNALSKLAKGTSGSMKNITKQDVLEVSFLAPSPLEQVQVGEYFRELDRLIGLHQLKHDKLLALKRAMLQKMFPQPGTTTPEIRFKGFSSPWDSIEMENLGQTYSGLFGKTKADFGSGGARFVTYMGVFSHAISNLNMTDAIGVDPSQNEVKKGDVLFTISSETPQEVGMSSVWSVDTEDVYLNSFCFGFRPLPSLKSDFLAYAFRTDVFRKRICVLAQGISRYNISKKKVMKIPVSIPEPAEQQKIGTYFRTLDDLIAKHSIQLQKLKQIKSACLEKMFV